MTEIRIASWNVNSVRMRFGPIARLVEDHAPDVLCLQETKVRNWDFPLGFFHGLGYQHAAIHGQEGYHGVAVLSRLPLAGIERRTWLGSADARHLVLELASGIELHNVYVPAGGDLPDPERNPKFAFKLRFLDAMSAWFQHRQPSGAGSVLVGDLNVAPLESDVWDHRKLLRVVTHTPVEVEKLARLQASCGWIDAVRHFIPPEERLYTWWSYRTRDWSAADKGRRLDHVWVSPALAPALVSTTVVREARGWAPPSDHVPVIVTLRD